MANQIEVEYGSSKRYFRRYTSIAAVLSILQENKLTLLSPDSWDDRNDRESFRIYRERTKSETVLALCMTDASETYHLWRTFAGGQDGACIVFRRGKFIGSMNFQTDLDFKQITYRPRRGLVSHPSTEDIPFTKNFAYRDEKEWRIVWTSKTATQLLHKIPLNIADVAKISLNPWLPDDLVAGIKHALHRISGWEEVPVDSSAVIRKSEVKYSDVP